MSSHLLSDGFESPRSPRSVLADSRSGEIVRFELGLAHHSVEKKADGYFVGFNAATDPVIRNPECGGDPAYHDIRTPAAARRVRPTKLMEDYRGELDTEAAKAILADHYDVYLKKADNPCSRTIDGHYELDRFEYWQARTPYCFKGAPDGRVMDSEMAGDMSLVFRWGNSCGMPFDAEKYFKENPQYDYLKGYIKDRPTQLWTRFKAGEASPRETCGAVRTDPRGRYLPSDQ